MKIEQRLAIAARIEKRKQITVGSDKVIAFNGLVYVNKVPMTWDTFTHIYLLDK